MSANLLDRMRTGLLTQRKNLEDWLNKAPETTKKVRLGPQNEALLEKHLKTIDTAIEKTQDQTLGLCDVCHDYLEPERLEMDYTACVCLEHMTGEQKSRLEEELELSQKVQKALLPHKIPNIPGLQLAVYSQPAQIVGGDYFDFFEHHGDTFGFAIGDVMGKGMPASLLMANLQASLRILVQEHEKPERVMDRLNCLFVHNIRLTKFVTLFIAQYDTRHRMLTYSNAGHNPPLWMRRDPKGGSVTWLRPTGAAVGLIEDAKFRSETIQMQSGDLLVFYTDGVTETQNSIQEEFGDERLLEITQANRDRSPAEIVKVIRESIRTFAGNDNRADDTTIMAAKIN